MGDNIAAAQLAVAADLLHRRNDANDTANVPDNGDGSGTDNTKVHVNAGVTPQTQTK